MAKFKRFGKKDIFMECLKRYLRFLYFVNILLNTLIKSKRDLIVSMDYLFKKKYKF
jgi:hypothetical protein